MARTLILLEDYRRITRVIASVLDAADANTPKACLFFAIAGAHILRAVYRVKAVPIGGGAFYRVDDRTGFAIAYGELDENRPISHDGAFHCWVVAENFAIDFMAPIFQASVNAGGRSEKVPCRMFQKPLGAMAPSPHDLTADGDFYLEPNIDLSTSLIEDWIARPGNLDLAEICLHWYRRPPKDIASTLSIASSDGAPVVAKLRPLELEGA